MAGWAHWFYYGLGGLRPDWRSPGFKHFVLAPQIPRKIEWARITHESPYGDILSSWKRTGDTVRWEVTVPANSTASALIPASGAGAVREGGKPLKDTGLTSSPGEQGTVKVELTAGSYSFDFKAKSIVPGDAQAPK